MRLGKSTAAVSPGGYHVTALWYCDQIHIVFFGKGEEEERPIPLPLKAQIQTRDR